MAGLDNDDTDDPIPGPSGVLPPAAGTSDDVNDMVNQLLSDNINHEHQLESIDNVAESTETALRVATTGLEELRRILEPYNGDPTAPPIPSTEPVILPGNVVRHRGKMQPSYDSSHLPDDGDRTLTLPPIRRSSPAAHADQATAPDPQDTNHPTPPADPQAGDDNRHASPPHNGGPPGDGGPPGGGPGSGGPGGGPPPNGGPPPGGPAARYDEGAREKIRRTLARYCNQQQSTRATTRRIMDIVHDATLHAMV